MNENTPSRIVILVVEDEPLQRMMAVDLVDDAGFEAVEATDAAHALDILEGRADVRIVFSNIDMPHGLDGVKLAVSIRERWPSIDLILTSEKVMLGAEELPHRGAFFSKPYRRQEVVAAMRRMAA